MERMVHLETLSTRMYWDKTPAEIMALVDQEINIYLWDTSYDLINVVEYGFSPSKNGKGARGYARIAVYINTKETDGDNPEYDPNDGQFHSSIKL